MNAFLLYRISDHRMTDGDETLVEDTVFESIEGAKEYLEIEYAESTYAKCEVDKANKKMTVTRSDSKKVKRFSYKEVTYWRGSRGNG